MKAKPTTAQFPNDFLWGAATAAHQVEGNTHNQWTVWELENAKRLANTAKDRLGYLDNWDDIADAAEDPENYVSGRGVDHYNRYEADFDLLHKLNLNSFRFSFEWSRIEPNEGTWDAAAVEHYRDYIASLRRRNIEPIATLWHWTMPVWFTDKGGFAKRENIVHFERFAQKIADEYGDDLRYVITLNEPNIYTAFSYANGEWPPGQKSKLSTLLVYRNLARAHRRTYALLKAAMPNTNVGIAANLSNMQPSNPHNPLMSVAAGVMAYGWNWWFLNRIKKYQDFVGVNYYFTDYIRLFSRRHPITPRSDLGWSMEPEGLYALLRQVHIKYHKPVLITENGLADEDDIFRRWWLEQTIIAMRRARGDGVELIGYLHWSLLDNFEWSYGWWPKFGLVSVDYDHGLQRTIRPSAIWLAKYLQRLQKNPKSAKETHI